MFSAARKWILIASLIFPAASFGEAYIGDTSDPCKLVASDCNCNPGEYCASVDFREPSCYKQGDYLILEAEFDNGRAGTLCYAMTPGDSGTFIGSN